MRVACLALSLGVISAGCASVEVRSDRPARVYTMGPSGMVPEGEIRPQGSLWISRLFHGDRFEVGCLSQDDHFAVKEVPSGETAAFTPEDWWPAGELLKIALDGRVQPGMNETEVLYAWGPPISESISEPPGTAGKTWTYERGFTVYFLFFRDGLLDSWSIQTYPYFPYPPFYGYCCW
ncbi:MAG: hypothetical protein ACE5F1_02885 [Planctomycetota bacterium]